MFSVIDKKHSRTQDYVSVLQGRSRQAFHPSLWKCGMPAFQDVAAVQFLGKGKDNTRASYGDVIQTP